MSDLVEQIDALLSLNAKGAVSHPVPGLAVELLERAKSALSRPIQNGGLVREIEALVDEYLDLAYVEGEAGRSTDTPKDDAQRVRFAISERLASLAVDALTPPAVTAGEAEPVSDAEETLLEDACQRLMTKIYNRGHSGLDKDCPLCQAYIATDRLLSFETETPLSEEVRSWDAAPPLPQVDEGMVEDGWKGMASRSSFAAAIAAEDRRLLLEDGRKLLDTLPPEWHDEATTNFRDLVGSIEERLAALTPQQGGE